MLQIKLQIRLLYFSLLDTLVPPACPLCRALLRHDDGLCAQCWASLDFISAPFCRISGVPVPYDLGEDTISTMARIAPPPYARARAALIYKDNAAKLIRLFKFSDRPEIARLLARLIYMAGGEVLAGEAVLMPVPLHRWRLLGRRFNQAAEIGRILEKLCGHSLWLNALIRTRATRQQIGLTRAGRRRNLRGAFAVAPNYKNRLVGKRVILLDDVLTTGATVEACAKVLLRAGVQQVDVLTVARVVMPERFALS